MKTLWVFIQESLKLHTTLEKIGCIENTKQIFAQISETYTHLYKWGYLFYIFFNCKNNKIPKKYMKTFFKLFFKFVLYNNVYIFHEFKKNIETNLLFQLVK